MTTELPRRGINRATGYPYTKHDHCQRWIMPDGTEFWTGWIDPGDEDAVASIVRGLGDQIDRLNENLEGYSKIYQTVSKEKQ